MGLLKEHSLPDSPGLAALCSYSSTSGGSSTLIVAAVQQL